MLSSLPDTKPIALDAHVHLYEPALALSVLAAASEAMRQSAGVDDGVLMLTESRGYDVFDRLMNTQDARLRRTLEPNSLWFAGPGARLLIVAGRQVVTAEGLEILCLGALGGLPDKRPAEETLAAATACGALAVLPWAAGKWLKARKALVLKVLDQARPGQLKLGDNGGRPWFWRSPILDRQTGLGDLLSGSDPLPLAKRWRRIGGFGVKLTVTLPEGRPAEALLEALKNPQTRLHPYGRAASLPGFVTDQVALRLGGRVDMPTDAAEGAAT